DSNPACNAFEASVSSAGLVAVLPVPTLGIVTAPRRGVLSRTGTGLRRGSQLPERVYPFQPLLVARPGIDPGGATDLQSALGAIPPCRAPSRPHQRQDLREATYPSSAEGVCRQFTIMPRMPLDLPSGSLRNRLKIKDPHRGLYRITSERRPVIVARTTATRLQNLDRAERGLERLTDTAILASELSGLQAGVIHADLVTLLDTLQVLSATGDGVPGGARILPLASVLVLVALAHSDSNLLDAARALLVIRRELRCGACVADDGNSCPGDVTGVLVNTHLSLSFSQLPSGALSSVPDSTGSIQIGGLIFRSSSSSVMLSPPGLPRRRPLHRTAGSPRGQLLASTRSAPERTPDQKRLGSPRSVRSGRRAADGKRKGSPTPR